MKLSKKRLLEENEMLWELVVSEQSCLCAEDDDRELDDLAMENRFLDERINFLESKISLLEEEIKCLKN